ncbi:TonB family protein [Hwanghaeella grinnelliae]|uniref:TonB family protein n=1 Tax=Hwanghaeella grinnelliae TaxID=2500179 RepID=A0A437QGH0_9PROT|nr:energy transducer TonB [Hwanghaeella grinnelliae]RVU33649.1 TonB family protein [Hwanghaeella grinnelliae]
MTHALPIAATPHLRARHWLTAFGVATALHAVVFLEWPADDQAGAEAPGVGGISVSIATTASLAGSDHASPEQSLAEDVPAPEAVMSESVSEPSPVVPPEALEAATVPVEPVVEPPPIQPPLVQPVVEPVPPEITSIEEVAPVEPIDEVPQVITAVEPPPEEAPVTEPAPETVTEAVTADIPQPRPPVRPKNVATKPVETKTVEPPRIVQTKPTVNPSVEPLQAAALPVQKAQPADTPSAQSSSAATASSGQAANAPVGNATDTRNSTGGAPVAAPSPNYIAKLRLWLERHKDYPRLARRKRMQGVVLLYFRVGRDGSVLAQEIREDSGHVLLDEAALEMLARATPLPTFPQDMPGDYLDVVLPVEYSLRGKW